jgi:transcription termination factor Rho
MLEMLRTKLLSLQLKYDNVIFERIKGVSALKIKMGFRKIKERIA